MENLQPASAAVIPKEKYEYAAMMLSDGKGPAEVKTILMNGGMDELSADTVIANAHRYADADLSGTSDTRGGMRDMVIGGIVCIVGIMITLLTYSAASHGGGRYVITYGAIIFGGVRFFRGLMKYNG